MAPLLVGDPECQYGKLALEISNSPSGSVALEHWSKLAMALDTSPSKVKRLREKLFAGLFNLEDVITELLVTWRSVNSDKATFNILLDIIEHNCDWKSVADSLWKRFYKCVRDDTTWVDLHQRTKDKIRGTYVNWFQRQEKLIDLLALLGMKETEQFFEKLVVESLREVLYAKEPIELVHCCMPVSFSYYVTRSLVLPNLLNPEAFKETNTDKFVIVGATLDKIRDLAGNDPVDIAYPYKPSYICRFIYGRNNRDYEHVCSVTTSEPVHLISHHNESYFWLKSQGTLSSIRSYLTDAGPISEKDFKDLCILSSDNSSVTLADFPGMGKSAFLSNIFRELSAESKRLNIFISLPEFIRHSDLSLLSNPEEIVQCLIKYLAASNIGRELLTYNLQHGQNITNVFMDAFDELEPQERLDALEQLKWVHLHPELKLFVTTRLHNQHVLEQATNSLSYKLLPLTHEQRQTLLVKFWEASLSSNKNEGLDLLARMILTKCVETSSTDKVCFAGIPLHCRILAEIYTPDRMGYQENQKLPYESFCPQSSYEMYTKLLTLRLETMPGSFRRTLLNWHYHAALECLFPEERKSINKASPTKWIENIHDKVQALGFVSLEVNGQRERRSYTFVHRSMAEYLVARWLQEFSEVDLWHKIMFCHLLNPVSNWGDNVIIVRYGTEFNATDISEYMQKHPLIDGVRKNWKKLMTALHISQYKISETQQLWERKYFSSNKQEDIILYILRIWIKLRSGRPLSDLVEALDACELQEVADHLKTKYYEKDFMHPRICQAVDSGLASRHFSSTILSKLRQTNFVSIIDNLEDVLKACLRSNYSNIFGLLISVLKENSPMLC